jgi:hypothetical protein
MIKAVWTAIAGEANSPTIRIKSRETERDTEAGKEFTLRTSAKQSFPI